MSNSCIYCKSTKQLLSFGNSLVNYSICLECQDKRDKKILELFNVRDKLLTSLEQKQKEIKEIEEQLRHLKWELEHRNGHFDYDNTNHEYYHRLFFNKYGKSWYSFKEKEGE